MKTLNHILCVVFIIIVGISISVAQDGSAQRCINAQPLCGSSMFSYPNTSGLVGSAENGPEYGCLRSQPNPSWFYLQIAQPGDLQFKIEQSSSINGLPNLDVDYVIYGPFSDPRTPCTSALTQNKIIDCSFSSDFVEFIDIPSTLAGEYYLLLITNFSRQPGFITVTQTAGAATSNCVFLEDPTEININSCRGNIETLNAFNSNAQMYSWFQTNSSGNLSLIPNEFSNQLEVTTSNRYRAEAYDANNVLVEIIEFNVKFFDSPDIPLIIEEFVVCDTLGENDYLALFNLSEKDAEILNGLSPEDFSVTYYLNESDAISREQVLNLPYENLEPVETIFVRVDNITTSEISCFDISSFTIRGALLPEAELEESYIICVNTNGTEEREVYPIINTQLNPSEYNFIWKLNGDNIGDNFSNYIQATEPGTYTVEVVDKSTNCSQLFTSIVIPNSPPEFNAHVTTLAFADQHQIEINVIDPSDEDYLYSLDFGDWQFSNIFNDVGFGEHLIRVKGVNGCGYYSEKVMVIDYPLYFTPNGDGYNDTWHIKGLTNVQQATTYIFDRYGKLITQLTGNSKWDGTFQGKPMVSNDYWFEIAYIEPLDNSKRRFRSNFTLKR